MAEEVKALRSTETWAIPIVDRTNIPAFFKAEYARYFQPDEAPYILHNPQQDRNRKTLEEKLICLTPDRLVVLSSNQAPFAVSFDEVVYFQHSEILLAFSIRIYTESQDTEIHYNSACLDLFEPVLSHLRIRGTSTKDGQAEWSQISHLAAEDLKFTNYARQILRDSGKLVDFVYQEELLGDEKPLIDTTLLILTDTELCWVHNDPKEWTEEPVYGGIFCYAARDKVVDCQQIALGNEGLYELIVTFRGNHTWKIPFAGELKDQIAALRHKILS
jgi:hypothetical protein